MRNQPLGNSSLVTTRLAYGCWRLVGTWEPSEVTADSRAAGRRAAIAAYEAGYTLFDHADIYCHGVCESAFGDVLREVRGMRDRILIATKCGIRFAGDPAPGVPPRYDSSADHILRSCEGSLRRLGIETIDLYQIHRPDFLMDPQEVAAAFDKLRSQGKVREFGVSNFPPPTLAALQRACPMNLIVNQVEIHLGRLDPFYDGTLDQCLTEGITPLAWSPLGGGLLAGPSIDPAHPNRAGLTELREMLDTVAAAHGTTRTVIALAWLLKHPAGIVPILGTTNPDRIAEATKADAIELSREDWYRLFTAARGVPLP